MYYLERTLQPFHYKFVYTPVLIEWVEAVIPIDSISVNPQTKKYLRITNPTSSLPGAKQSLKSTNTFIVPDSGIMKFKLVPSDFYNPQGIYTVEVLEGKSQILIESQKWIVPLPPDPLQITITHSTTEMNSIGEIPVYEVISINRSGEYKIVGQQILWLSNPPEDGETYSIVYQPAVTLDKLKVHKAG